MKLLLLLLPILASCLPQSPKDKVESSGEPVFDPLASQAWHLENTAQHAFSEGYAIAGEDHKIRATHLLGLTGKNIRIAISDDAVQVAHPDLEANQLMGEHRDYTSSDPFIGDPAPQNYDDAHGTAVTGLIAAVKGNTIGSYGVAPDALFAGFNYLSSDGNGVLETILHQMDGNFNIFNYSYGIWESSISGPYDPDIANALKLGVMNGANYVKAAGNSYIESDTKNDLPVYVFGNANFETEQTLPYYVVVGAINAHGKRSSYSTPGSNLWISGAGGEFGTDAPAMITTDLTGCSYGYAHGKEGLTPFDKGFNELNKYCDFMNTMNGTSSATPVISGIIALLLEANPNLSWRDVKHILAKTADRVDYTGDNEVLTHPQSSLALTNHTYDVKWTRNAAGNYFSNWYGFGRANALAASLMALGYNNSQLGTYVEETAVSSGAINVPIPYSAVGTSHTINVASTLTIESVQVEVTVVHPDISDLGIELTSPLGTVSRLFLINSNATDEDPSPSRVIQLLTNAFYEEAANGPWTLKILDGRSPKGQLASWSIKINGHQ